MIAAELITNNIPALQPNDTVEQALSLMQEFHLSQLPIVIDQKSAGLLHEEDIQDADLNSVISSYIPLAEQVHVKAEDFFLTALKIMQQRKLSLLPVIKDEKEYIGAITAEELLQAVSKYNAVTEPGGVIILQMTPTDFSCTELGRIVESNDCRIIHLNTWTNTSTGELMVAIKVNKTDIHDILATLERYEYNVIQYFGENLTEEELKLNFDHLMNYLNI